ncbi:MAG: DUF3098 domain-containing protein [Candidatus Zixiibacteriota bacterium]|nr:MAG: DUF3098 domain-containing protein [candidate division Zixibacteria bacterium]
MATAKKKVESAENHAYEWPFGKKNYILLAISLAVIVLGFILLWQGDITLAPILLVLGYGMVPFAIMAKGKVDEAQTESDD